MFKKLQLRYKILTIPALAAVVLVMAVIFINTVIRKNGSILDQMVTNNVPAWETSYALLEDMSRIQSAFESALILKRGDKIQEADKLYADFLSRVQSTDEAHENGLADLVQNYYALARHATQEQIQGRNRDEISDVLQNMQNQYTAIQEKLRATSQANLVYMQENLTKAQHQNRNSLFAVVGSLFILLPFIFGVALFILSSITKPLKVVIDVAERVAEGDLTVQIPETGARDEISILTQKMQRMISNLRELTLQIKEAANSLAAASSEISASVTQIASGATETATAANETSTTVEEVRQTALDSSRKAKYVSESAQKAVQISQSGEKAVNVMVEGMQRIESQMASIAESILKLSEHGQAIGGIIATVEDVAEQSNLLAVNASIEAAKAGEQGKGFAVVAMEVKSLAEQSRQATSRVRGILDDIQKATGGAVSVTEQGSKAVESGVEMSSNAGDSIQRLANSVNEAAQATTQIAVSSQEQLVGMDQVVSAMESIKQASTQNVTATKQVESAAHDLHELGQNLKHLVEQYRV